MTADAREGVMPGVYPPSFCNWRMLLSVALVTQLALLLIAVGRLAWPGWAWLGMASLYAQWLGLSCAAGLCFGRAWLQRLSPRPAWIASWVLTVVLAGVLSYCLGIVGTVLRLGPERLPLDTFVAVSVLAVALVSAALLRYLFVRMQWRMELLAQADARVQALQARIRPHFLFNSLNTIASLIPEDPEGAERATEDLADLFRGSMRRADRLISLSEELELARKYLDMEQRRLGERLRLEWNVADLPEDAAMLPLTLQPLLENAVGHGIQRRPDGGMLKVYGRAADGQVVVTIYNSVPEEMIESTGHGMALNNIQERLALAFGSRASLITRRESDAFYAVLSVPYVARTDR